MLRYDLHLSAYQIGSGTVAAVEAMGFRRDMFANSRRCDTTAFHATYRGATPLPDDRLWSEICEELAADTSFVGGLEEEEFDPAQTHTTMGGGPTSPPLPLPAMAHFKALVGVVKACDIHINVPLADGGTGSLALLELLQLPSFDKPQPDGDHRVFSVTCDDYQAGAELFAVLCTYAELIPGLPAKLKFERTRRFFRKPADAPTLPVTPRDVALNWIKVARSTLGAAATA